MHRLTQDIMLSHSIWIASNIKGGESLTAIRQDCHRPDGAVSTQFDTIDDRNVERTYAVCLMGPANALGSVEVTRRMLAGAAR